ncbi:MAG: hypothetical protein SF187_05630 [Deltaproteobacteria bacterium]|nr:hypothetical protein [Deltaproteobacteria bacterium]
MTGHPLDAKSGSVGLSSLIKNFAVTVILIAGWMGCSSGAGRGDQDIGDGTERMDAANASGMDSGGTTSPTMETKAPGDGEVASTKDGMGCGEVGVIRVLPGTGSKYCVAWNKQCEKPGGNCPLLVAVNMDHRFFKYLSDPTSPPYIAVESYQETDGQGVKDKLAEIPRVITKDFPGLDPERIYAIGWSAGAGAVSRGLCMSSKNYDESSFGTTSDIYAAMVTAGGCSACSDGFMPIAGNTHVFATNGSEDPFAAEGCVPKLKALAKINGCSQPEAKWCNVAPADALVPNAPGNDRVRRISFGTCPRGDVEAYLFMDEGHDITYKKHLDPRARSYDMIFRWLQGRRKPLGAGQYGPVGKCQ